MVYKTNILLSFLTKIKKKLLFIFYMIVFFLLWNSTITHANVELQKINDQDATKKDIISIKSTDPILVKEGSTSYTAAILKAAYAIKILASGKFSINGITINGTLDGGHYIDTQKKVIQAKKVAKPALLIHTKLNEINSLTIASLTIGTKGMLTTENASALKIAAPIKGYIVNNGTITANTCIEIIAPITSECFLVDGSLTNNGIIKAKNQGIALSLEGASKNTNTKEFQIINTATMEGNLIFKGKNNGCNYRLNNKRATAQTNMAYINADNMQIENASLTIINDKSEVKIKNLTLTSNSTKTILNIININEGTFTVAEKIKNKGIITINGTVTFNEVTNYPNSSITSSGGLLTLGTVDNLEIIHAKDNLSLIGNFSNDGSLIIDKSLILTSDIVNKSKMEINNIIAKQEIKIDNHHDSIITINKSINQRLINIENDGCLCIKADSVIKSYNGSGELVINAHVFKPKAKPLLEVTDKACFNKKSKIIIGIEPYNQPEVDITIVKAKELVVADDINKVLYSVLHAKSLLINITDAKIINNSITAKVKQVLLNNLDIYEANKKLITSLLNRQIICAEDQKFKTDKEYKLYLDQKARYKNQQNIENISLITTTIDSILDNRGISFALAAIDVPRVENHQSVSDNNKIISSVSTRQKEKRKQWLQDPKNMTDKKESSVEVWMLASYHVSKQKEKYLQPYKEWQDSSMCVAVESNNSNINAGLCYIHTKSEINIKLASIKHKKMKYATRQNIKMKSSSGLAYVVHELNSISNSYAFMYGKTEHQSDNREDFYSREYSAMILTSYNMRWNTLEIDLGVTSRYINIYTPIYNYKLSDISIGYSSKNYLSLGPVISFAINSKLFDYIYTSLELNLSYLRTAGINDKNEIDLMLKSKPFMKIKQEYYVKDSLHAEFKCHLLLNKLSLGLIANCNYDTNRLLYGGSAFIGISF